jgi:DNA-binding NarL/FixJ family response regulator
MEKISIVSINHDRIFNELLANFIKAQAHFLFWGNFIDLKEVFDNEQFSNMTPAIIILGLQSNKREDALKQIGQDIRQLRIMFPESKMLVIGQETEKEVIDCIRYGAAGYCLQSASLETLTQTIEALSLGESLCSPKLAAELFAQTAEQPFLDIHLTTREKEVLHLLDKNLSNKEIASDLNISVQTVKNHIHNMLQKLKLDGRKEAVRFAKQNKILEVF